MKKLNIFAMGLAALVMAGCTVTNQEKNLMKEPNGNIRVETATIKKFVPVSYSYETDVTSCSEVAFLTHVTTQDPSINNIYEIHWNQIENHRHFMGIKGTKKYTCEFWGVGIQYGDPLPLSSSSSQSVQTTVVAPAAVPAVVEAPAPAVEVAVAPAEAAPVAVVEPAPDKAVFDSAKTEKAE